MKKAGMGGQGYNSRLDESLGARNGKKSQKAKKAQGTYSVSRKYR